jgi:hypothetical protein
MFEESDQFFAADRTGSGTVFSFTSRDGLSGLAEGRLGMPLDRGSAEGPALLANAWTLEAVVQLDMVSDGRFITVADETGTPVWTLEVVGGRLRVRSDDASSTLEDVIVTAGVPLVLGAQYDGANISAFLGDASSEPVTAVLAAPASPVLHVGPYGAVDETEPPIAGSLFQLRVSDFVRPAASRLGARFAVRLD